MSWWRREVYLILLGAAALALSIIVLVRDTNLSTELLGSIGVLGGLAIVVVSLPVHNGKHED
jgi:formate-dependent nitrite reductase membrane component NrfD